MMTTIGAAVPAEVSEDLGRRFVTLYETLDPDAGPFADDTLFDLNVPMWRHQVRGPKALVAWLREHTDVPYRIPSWRQVRTETGLVVELEGVYPGRDGEELYFRNLWLFVTDGGRVTEAVMYCTGDWDTETRRRHAAHAPMIRK